MNTTLTDHQRQLAFRIESCIGERWPNDAGKWVNRIKSDSEKCDRVISEVECAKKECRIRTTAAQYAEFIWGQFAPANQLVKDVTGTRRPNPRNIGLTQTADDKTADVLAVLARRAAAAQSGQQKSAE